MRAPCLQQNTRQNTSCVLSLIKLNAHTWDASKVKVLKCTRQERQTAPAWAVITAYDYVPLLLAMVEKKIGKYSTKKFMYRHIYPSFEVPPALRLRQRNNNNMNSILGRFLDKLPDRLETQHRLLVYVSFSMFFDSRLKDKSMTWAEFWADGI